MKILLIDDDPIVVECLGALVKNVGQPLQLIRAATLAQGITAASIDEQIRLAFVGLEQFHGLDSTVIGALRTRFEHIPVVILASSEAEHLVLGVLDAGAAGFICKDMSTYSLMRTLRSALSGDITVPSSVLKARGLYNPSHKRTCVVLSTSDLNQSQKIVIRRLMLQGRSNQAIAAFLGIAEPAVRAEISSLLKALSVTSRSELMLVLAGTELGKGAIIPIEPSGARNIRG